MENEAAGQVAALALDWIASEDRARLLVSGALEVFWANVAARDLIGSEPDLEIRDRRLQLTQPACHDHLVRLVGAATPEPSDLVHARSEGQGHLLFKAREIRSGRNDRTIGLELWRPDRIRSRFADFRVVFGLTQSEDRVMRELLEGRNAAQISSSLRCSIDTVRSHIRRIYEKAEVSSREALFRRCRPFLL